MRISSTGCEIDKDVNQDENEVDIESKGKEDVLIVRRLVFASFL